MATKAAYAAFQYGGPDYPVHEDNRPVIDEAAVRELLAPVIARMSELSGGHRLDQPNIAVSLMGNGYVVVFSIPASESRHPISHEFANGVKCYNTSRIVWVNAEDCLHESEL